MKFPIHFKKGENILTVIVESIHLSETIQRFRLVTNNRHVVIQNNKSWLKTDTTKPKEWKLIEGTINNSTTFNQILKVIESKLESMEKPEYIN
jgi:dephospho-CoA kinase